MEFLTFQFSRSILFEISFPVEKNNILGFFLTIFSEIVEDTLWDIFLNPFGSPRQYTEMAFQQIVWKNRVFLSVGSLVFILGALLNLQNREKYI